LNGAQNVQFESTTHKPGASWAVIAPDERLLLILGGHDHWGQQQNGLRCGALVYLCLAHPMRGTGLRGGLVVVYAG